MTIAGAALRPPSTARGFPGQGISVAGTVLWRGVLLAGDAQPAGQPDRRSFPDALQEFSVATSGLTAQNGMHSGASVNAVTKSGTNRLSGNVFEFLRDRRFNAIDPFSPVGPGGKKKDDGLNRNQYGGTFGGPIVQNRLFFFAGVQGTRVKQQPASITAWVPTAAMLNGDFTAFASPQCNGGLQLTLTGGFVNNRVNPALLSPAAVKMTTYLPTTTDPCGEVKYTMQLDSDERQYVGKVDFQRTANDTIFGRYNGPLVHQGRPSGRGHSPELV